MKQATLYHLQPESIIVARYNIEFSTIASAGTKAVLCNNGTVVMDTVEKHNLRVHNFVETKYDRNKQKVVEKESFIAMTPEVEEVLRTVLVAKYMEKIEGLENSLNYANKRAEEDHKLMHFYKEAADKFSDRYYSLIMLPWWKRLFYKGEKVDANT